MRDCESTKSTTDSHSIQTEGRSSAEAIHNSVGTRNATNSFGGSLDILYVQRKLPNSVEKNMMYKFGLLIYYFLNLIYLVFALVVHQDHSTYHVVHIVICLTGFLFELTALIVNKRNV